MTYSEAVDFLYHKLPMFSRQGATAFRKDLTNIRTLCKALGNPQDAFKSIHVGGTNGKGSVSHMLAAIFQESGYKTGLHTSPHLVDFRERMKINGAVVPEAFVVHFIETHRALIEEIRPSFFEISVAMSFSWFAENEVDIAVIEVGLGGRLDSTNIVSPVLSVITNISLEHTQILGNTRALIAGEKAGIIKHEIPVVIGETHPETEPVFLQKAEEMNAPLIFADRHLRAIQAGYDVYGQLLEVKNTDTQEQTDYLLDLSGMYQQQNVQTVLQSVNELRKQGWQLPERCLKLGLAHAQKLTGLRGRWEILGQQPLMIADTGHNVAGITFTMRQVNTLNYGKLHIVTGFVRDKNVEEILPLFPVNARYYFCHADNPRALPADKLKETAAAYALQGEAFPSVGEAFTAARKQAHPEDVLLITGSTFIVAEVLAALG